MLKVDSTTNRITLTRGDTMTLKIALTDADGEVYIPGGSDVIRFAVKKNYDDENPLININADIDRETGEITLIVPPEATKNLRPGMYKYDIQLSSGGGTIVDTFIDRAVFHITEEVD